MGVTCCPTTLQLSILFYMYMCIHKVTHPKGDKSPVPTANGSGFLYRTHSQCYIKLTKNIIDLIIVASGGMKPN